MTRIIVIRKSRFLIGIFICLLLIIICFVTAKFRPSQEANNSIIQSIEAQLRKENTKLEDILKHILPESAVRLYEPSGRYDEQEHMIQPQPDAVKNGTDIAFQILHDDTGYRRVIYSPDWKDAYFRGWLYLPNKIIQARHSLFIYSTGASANYDLAGELAFEQGVPMDNHRNINFLVFDFKVQGVKRFGDQLMLVGKPFRSGVQIVSVVQNLILMPKEKERHLLVQLVTPGGYEVDYDYTQVMQYDYRMEQIREHSVNSTSPASMEKSLDALIDTNLKLKKDLSFFIPVTNGINRTDNIMTMELCKPIPPTLSFEEKKIGDMVVEGQSIQMKELFEDPAYRRPVFDPTWKKYYRKYWSYIPEQMCLNLSRLHVLPAASEDQEKLLGMLGFAETDTRPASNETGFIIYGFQIDQCVIYGFQIFFIGSPRRNGVSFITIDNRFLNDNAYYVAQLITPDHEEIDYAVLSRSGN